MWQQVYDPLNNAVLSTAFAALPIVVLLGSLAFLKMQAHIAALVGLVSALVVAILVFGMPATPGRRNGSLWRRLRPDADRLDHPQRHLPLSAHQRSGTVRDLARQHHHGDARPAAATAPRGVLLWRVLRGCIRVRHAGGRHRRDSDRPWLLSARRIRTVAHREHRAGRVRRAGDADPRAPDGHERWTFTISAPWWAANFPSSR